MTSIQYEIFTKAANYSKRLSQYLLYVSIDTCSRVIFASPLSGKKASHVITHCLEAWSAWDIPKVLKTDNGPAYTSAKFKQFCHHMGVSLLTGLPYSPQGQGIVERANKNLKKCLQKQKGGIAEGAAPWERVSLALFTLNFLHLDDDGKSAADRHASEGPPDEERLVM